MIEDKVIKMFCAIDSCRNALKSPFNFGAYTYATNGYFAIRLDRIKAYDSNEVYENISTIEFDNDVPESKFIPLTGLSVVEVTRPCPECGGKGSGAECDDCEGTGEVNWESKNGYDYDDICQMCSGRGKVEGPCERCGGSGQTSVEKIIEVENKLINCRLLIIMNNLPNCRIAPAAVEDLKPIPFKFDGGVGIVMPLRKGHEYYEKKEIEDREKAQLTTNRTTGTATSAEPPSPIGPA